MKNKYMKLIFVMMTAMSLMFSAHAGQFIFDQSEAKERADLSDGVNKIQFFVEGDTNENQTFNNITSVWDIDFQVKLEDEFYFTYQNTVPGDNITIETLWSTDEVQTTFTKFDILMEDVGTYYFVFVPDEVNEGLALRIDYPDTFIDTEQYFFTRDRGLTDGINLFIDRIIEFIDLNLLIVELGVYIISFSVAIFILFSLINLLINVHKKINEARKVNEESKGFRRGRE